MYCVKFLRSLTREVWKFLKTADYPPPPKSYGGQAADVTDQDCRGSRVGCFVMDAGGTPAATELLRREGGDDFFEARLAAQRVPERVQFQIAITNRKPLPG